MKKLTAILLIINIIMIGINGWTYFMLKQANENIKKSLENIRQINEIHQKWIYKK